MITTTKDASRSVLSRALAVLEAFDRRHPVLSLSEIARRAGLPLATAHRHVRELERWQALRRRGDGTYEIGARIRRLAALDTTHDDLVRVAVGPMRHVAARSGDTAVLAVAEDGVDDGTVVLTVAGTRPIPLTPPVGRRWPVVAARTARHDTPARRDAAGATTGDGPALVRAWDPTVPDLHVLVAPLELPWEPHAATLALLLGDAGRIRAVSGLLAEAATVVARRIAESMRHG